MKELKVKEKSFGHGEGYESYYVLTKEEIKIEGVSREFQGYITWVFDEVFNLITQENFVLEGVFPTLQEAEDFIYSISEQKGYL